MKRVETLTDVPDDAVDQIVSDYQDEGATVTKKKQPNGKWTVTATFSSETLAAAKTGGDEADEAEGGAGDIGGTDEGMGTKSKRPTRRRKGRGG